LEDLAALLGRELRTPPGHFASRWALKIATSRSSKTKSLNV